MTTAHEGLLVTSIPEHRMTQADLAGVSRLLADPDVSREQLACACAALLAEAETARATDLGDTAAATLATIDDSGEHADPSSFLPEGWQLLLSLRERDEMCTSCEGEEAHKVTEMAIVTGLDAPDTLRALSEAMRRVGQEAGIGVGIIDPRMLAGMMAMGGMGVPPFARESEPDASGPAPKTGQYL